MNYKLIGQRYLRKYTEAKTSPTYAAAIEAQTIVDALCGVPWQKVSAKDATMTYHTEETVDEVDGQKINGLDMNVRIRDQFDAALFCAGHVGGQHRAYANAAVYHYVLPDGTLPKLTKLTANVTSDPYNSAGARIAILTNATGEIPTNCNECRTGDAHADGVAPRTVAENGNWFPTMADCVFSSTPGEGETALPSGGLQLQKHLFVFVLMESYSIVRGNWLEGCSFIRNLVSVETDVAVPGWTDGATYDLAENASIEFNVCRGGVLPQLVGEVSGVQALDVSLEGEEIASEDLYRAKIGELYCISEKASIGLRTVYGIFYKGMAKQISALEYKLQDCKKPGAAFSVSARSVDGSDIVNSLATEDGIINIPDLKQSNVAEGNFTCFAYGGGVFVAGSSYSTSGIMYSNDFGRTWIKSNLDHVSILNFVFMDGLFFASDGSYNIYSSSNGSNWDEIGTLQQGGKILSAGNGVLIASFLSSNNGIMYSRDNGTTWNQSDEISHRWKSAAYGEGVFVAGGLDSVGLVYSNDNGLTWKKSNIESGTVGAISFSNGVFVAVMQNGSDYTSEGIFYSSDYGKTWYGSSVSSGNWLSVCYCNGAFVASGNNTGIYFSSDNGKTWTLSKSIEGVVYGMSSGMRTIVIGKSNLGIFHTDEIAYRSCWKIMSSVLFLRTSIPLYFNAKKVRIEWDDWNGVATPGAKFNVWMKSGEFSLEYDQNVVKNHLIYTAQEKDVSGYRLLGVIDATDQSRSATFDIPNLNGNVATILLTAYISMDDVNPSSEMQLPVGAANGIYVDQVNKRVIGIEQSWRPDITLIG